MVTVLSKWQIGKWLSEDFLKKWEVIVAIKPQRYLSTFCPTTKLRISAMFHFICIPLYSRLIRICFTSVLREYINILLLENLFLAHYRVTDYRLELLPHKVDLTKSVVDIFGDEFDFFISAMTKVPGTSFKSVCINNIVWCQLF